jgi:predicted ferric reductase
MASTQITAAEGWLTRRRPLQWVRALWSAAYAVCVLGPAALMTLATPAGTSPLTAAADAVGLIGLAVLGLQLLLPARWGPLTAAFGTDTLMRLHRPLAAAGTAFVLAHVALLMIDDPTRLGLFDVWTAPWRAKFAVLATASLGALIGTSVWRRRLRLSYEHWRSLHLGLGLILMVGSTAHALLVGHFLAGGPLRLAAVSLLAVSLAGVLFLRVGRPLAVNRRYVVEMIEEETEDAVTVQLRADGHEGVPFAPGQFAWLKPADRPLALVEHPFSFASSAHRRDRPAFTVREVGDFTRGLRALVGRRVVLDGPHGGWSPRHPERGLVLLVAGIGITPAMSVLRTLADERRSPPVTLVYASRDPDAVIFADEIADLERRLPLRVVHLPGREPGVRRRLDAGLLQDVLGPAGRRCDVLVCGGPGFTRAALAATAQFGIPRERVHAEDFALA